MRPGVTLKSFKLVRAVWRSVTDELGGNIDVQARKRNCGRAPSKIAAYLSKYMTKAYAEGEPWSNPITQVNTKAWRNALKRAGIEDFRWHDLRHTFATWHREAGTPTHELQRLGGWKTQSMVERYAHVAPEGLQLAASRLDVLLAELR